MRPTLLACAACLLICAPVQSGDDDLLRLPIGDPERKKRTAPLVLDALTDCRSGEQITPDDLPPRLEHVKLLFVGESHTSIDFHRAQLRVIRALHEAGRRVLIGLEMYPYTEQEFLDQWGAGLLTEEGFVALSDWYDNWGYHWNYYREIFLYARDNAISMHALNTPREVIKSVRTKGFENLTEEEASRVPTEIDTDSKEHLRLFKAYFSGGDESFHSSMSKEQWRGMFNAQCAWDATMAYNSVRALQQHDSEGAIMVVLVGSGHVAYGLGIQRQAAQWFDGGMASIVPINVLDEQGKAVDEVQASYADFVWGLPQFVHALYPGLGVSTVKSDDGERRRVIHVAEDSVAERAGFAVGDVLLAMNGTDLPDRAALNRMMSELRWGDSAEFAVDRGGETVTLTARFLRNRPEPCDAE
jgi:uncharacterized iron-regulated protein